MMTPDTDKTIKDGLDWLARTQNDDGSFGSGPYRGNIAVTSLAGLAFMVRTEGDDRRVPPLCQAIAECRRRFPLHAPGRC